MAALCWTLVLTVLLHCTGTSLADVDQDWLTSIVENIKNEYTLGDTFSLAVNVPLNQDPNNLQEILQYDPAGGVQRAVSEGRVYQGRAVIAAAALSRVLKNIQPFIQNSQGHFLILYSEESPCGATCATNGNDGTIAAKINAITQHWSGYAFVFSRVSGVSSADTSKLSEAFKRLDISKFGLNNIFRCFGDDSFECTSCSSGGDVAPSCVANDATSDQADDAVSLVPGTGTDAGEMISQGLDIGTSVGDVIGSGLGGGGGEGRKGKGGVRRTKGRKGKGAVRRRKGRKGKGGVRQRKGRKGKGGVRRRKGRKGKGGVRCRKGRKGRKGGRRQGKGCKTYYPGAYSPI